MSNIYGTLMCCQTAKKSNYQVWPGRHDGCLGAQWWGRCWSSPRSACPSSTCRCTRRGTRRGSRRWTRSPGSPGAGETSLSSLRLDSIKNVLTWKVGLPKERDGIADLSVTCEGWSLQSPFHKAPVSPTSTITPNEIYLFLSCALTIQWSAPEIFLASNIFSSHPWSLLDEIHFTSLHSHGSLFTFQFPSRISTKVFSSCSKA